MLRGRGEKKMGGGKFRRGGGGGGPSPLLLFFTTILIQTALGINPHFTIDKPASNYVNYGMV